jgi:hypothetical protein
LTPFADIFISCIQVFGKQSIPLLAVLTLKNFLRSLNLHQRF